MSAMTPIFNRFYIGAELTYNYNAYQLDKRLLSDINNNSLSAEIYLRF